MKKILSLLFIITILLTSCNKQNVLNGTFSDNSNDGKVIYLFELDSIDQGFTLLDSTIISNKKFKFELEEITNPSFGSLVIKDTIIEPDYGIWFVLENGHIKVTIDSVKNISGTPINDRYQDLINKSSVIYEEIDALEYKNDSDSIKQMIDNKASKFRQQIVELRFNFTKENINNKAGLRFFYTFFNLWSKSQINSLKSTASHNQQKLIDKYISDRNLIGKTFINIEGNDPLGHKINISDYVGTNKLVLLDFWASWCGPCIEEMPNVAKAYTAYKDKGFQIVGVSSDDDKTAWTKAIKKHNMTWPQITDDNNIRQLYHVEFIPFTVLIDQNGNIIAQNLRGNHLINKLKELLD